MGEQLFDIESTEKKDLKHLEDSLQLLWDKARRVSDTLLRLKAENKELRDRISSLELKEHRAAEELQHRESDVNELQAQLKQAQSNGQRKFSKEESEVLKSRLKELILKINSRL